MKVTIFDIIRASIFFSWSLLLIFFSVLPGDKLVDLGNEESGFRWDYLEHLFVFIIFSVTFLWWRKEAPLRNSIGLLLISGVIFAVFTEALQLFIPSRSFNYVDVLFNIAGVLAGGVGMLFLQRILRQKRAT